MLLLYMNNKTSMYASAGTYGDHNGKDRASYVVLYV